MVAEEDVVQDFNVWKENEWQETIRGSFNELFNAMETNKSSRNCIFWLPLGFKLSDGRKVIQFGRFEEFSKIEDEIKELVKEYEEKKNLENVENAIKMHDYIYNSNIKLIYQLYELEKLGYAKKCFWCDKYDSHITWLVSKNKDLITSIGGIDGFSDNDDYWLNDTNDLMPQTPEILRWTM